MARQTFYFGDGPYLQSMQGLHAAMSGDEAFVKFIGQPRTGKSGVCEKLTQFMRLKDYRVIYFDYAIESPDMLRSMLAKELDIPDSYNMFRHLEDSLATESGKPLVLIFDDAHQLSDITLIEIYRLAGVQVNQKRVINIVLSGEPELERRLSRKKEFTSLLHYVSHNFLLEPMSAATTSQFLSAYLEKTELAGLQLEPAALNQFYKSCKGFPGPAYSLCQLVLSIRQDKAELHPITRRELLLAIRSVDSEQPVPSGLLREGNRWMLFGPLAAVVVIASLAFLVRELNPPEQPLEVAELENLTADSSGGTAAVTADSSPFAVDELSEVKSGSLEVAGALDVFEDMNSQPQGEESLKERAGREEEVLVSDSNLALVTAQERGISTEIITEPEFEQMESDNAVSNIAAPVLAVIDESTSSDNTAALANVTLTRPMLALDDEEIVLEVQAQQNPITEPAIEPQETVLESVTGPSPNVPTVELTPELTMPSSPPLRPQQVVQNWIDAWEGQDLENYFASYDESFIPRYHNSKSAWRSNRERVIGNASEISLEISDFVLISEDAESIEVHFWLAYQSPTYRDDTRKKVILRKLPASESEEARLLILEEINLEVRV